MNTTHMQAAFFSIFASASFALASQVSCAEDMLTPEAWYVMPGISYMHTDSDLEADNGRGVFIKLGREIFQNWDIQGGLAYNRADEDTGIPAVGGRYKQLTLGVDALYLFNREKFRPFLLLGVGVTRNDVDYSHNNPGADAIKTSLSGSVGLGAQYWVSDRFALQADLRHQRSVARTTTDHDVFDKDTQAIGNNILNIGAIFRFGAPAQSPLAAAHEAPAHETPHNAAPTAAAQPMTETATEPLPETVEQPAPPAAAAAQPCTPAMETITISAEALFAFNDTKMRPGSMPKLDDVVEQLKAHPEFKLVMVTGHADRIGSTEYNQTLSEQRAAAVKRYLVSKGVEATRLQVMGKGESEPVVECNDVSGKQLIQCLQPNRRAVISDQKQSTAAGCP